ncbi:hypothetical protein LUZ63_013367 [Rhynchospora breviuscula]|uniref:non-specific serine/threonine protein kinase n=1 Tax=Rhynchospora breviuscula TaxID=2022672 RepID=A0A9Q0C8L5_9POAL|nr:hypothetical protein LUZ63_013367 [Rhynchospora breviuscula]
MHSFALFLFLTLCSLSQPLSATTDVPVGIIQRATKQQILATIAPNTEQNIIPFLTSPSGKFTACLIRHETAPGAGGFGNDFCFVQVQDTASGKSMWESECAPVSNVNTCALLFTWNGLEIFDGSNSVWDNGAASADNNFLLSLELVDQGDMRIHDKDGELAWKASDEPRVDQHCGMPGSPGLAPALPPFAEPIGQDKNLPFGQSQQQPEAANPIGLGTTAQGQIHQPNSETAGVGQAFGFNSQPLVDNTPYDSGCYDGKYWAQVNVGLVLGVFFVLMF